MNVKNLMSLTNINQLTFKRKLPFPHKALADNMPEYISYGLDNGFELVIDTDDGNLGEDCSCWIVLQHTGRGTLVEAGGEDGLPSVYADKGGRMYLRVGPVFVGPYESFSKTLPLSAETEKVMAWDLCEDEEEDTQFYILIEETGQLVERAPFITLASPIAEDDLFTGMHILPGYKPQPGEPSVEQRAREHLDPLHGLEDPE